MDPLAAVFVFCFVFGVATTLLSFALGAIHVGGGEHGGGNGHGHAGIGGDGHGHGHFGLGDGGHGSVGHGAGTHGALHAGGPAGHSGHGGHVGQLGGDDLHARGVLHEGHIGEASPFNLQTITAFMAFFGGTGWVAYTSGGLAPALALILATLAGIAGGGVVFWFLVKVLIANQLFMDPDESRMEGTVARVTRRIGAGHTGEIVYLREGSRHSEGALSATGDPIDEGTEVVIVRYERGLAYVEPWSSYAEEG